jgi:hypothetical protein
VAEKWSEGLLVGTRPLRLAELICRMLVDGVRAVYGTLLLDVDTVWAGAVNTVLVKEGVTVSELRWGGEAPGTLKPRTWPLYCNRTPQAEGSAAIEGKDKAEVITEARNITFERCGLDSSRIHRRLLGCLV